MKTIQAADFEEIHGGWTGLGISALSGAIHGGLAAQGVTGTAIGTATGAACGAAVGMATGGNNTAATAAGAVCGAAQNGATAAMSGSSSSSNSGGGGSGGGKVICTELCRTGVIAHDIWMADLQYSRKNFSVQTMRGYHLWGIPYVKLMRRSPIFAKLAAAPTRWFAEDIAYRMGVMAKPNYKGWMLRELAFRPMCFVIGMVAKSRDWSVLWQDDRHAA